MSSSSPALAILSQLTPISQGAEAKVYKAHLHANSVPVLLKHRFSKKYRHPSLDTSITRSRVAGEARTLMKCLRAGVNVPAIRMVDANAGVLGIEWIEGRNVRTLLPGADVGDEDTGPKRDADSSSPPTTLSGYGISQDDLMKHIGIEIAKMHQADIIHSDLTTSNMMLRYTRSATDASNATDLVELVLIDFGLAYHSTLVEDKAVDLYVLERAFSSTHPDSEPLFALVLQAYGECMGKEWADIKRRLRDVRLRGRKRSMVG